MKPLKLLTMLLTLMSIVAPATAQDAVSQGSQVTSEDDLVSGNTYLIYYVGNNTSTSAYMKDTGSAYTGLNDNSPTESAAYIFTKQSDGKWTVQNDYTRKYWGVPPTTNSTAYIATDDATAAGHWTLNFLSGGNLAPSCLDTDGTSHSWNRSDGKLHPWSAGTAAVNQFQIYEIATSGVNITVAQGHQTTGVGNSCQALLRLEVVPITPCTPTMLQATLTGHEQLDKVAVYMTSIDELHATDASPGLLGETSVTGASVEINLSEDTQLNAGETYYLWLTADVKDDATEWAVIDAAVTSLSYLPTGSTTATVADISAQGDPEGAMRIYKQQCFLWTSHKEIDPQYYRIPALLRLSDNDMLAFTDNRYTNHGDLGSHKIDVVVKKTTDGGLTWGNEVTVAAGDGSSDAAYGYGDAAVALAANGDVVCLMAAGKNSYSSGMKHIGFTKSSDGGQTWTTPVDIYDNTTYLTNPHATGTTTPFTSTFVSSGHGLTQRIAHQGRIAFPALGKLSGVTNEYIIYSDDNGEHWTFTDAYGYTGADESKLEEMNDGTLLMSVRTGGYNSTGTARGYNRTTNANDVESWGTQGTWGDLTANGCNSDLIYYSRSTANPSRPDVLLHSIIKTYDRYRKDLRLYASFDQGATWQEAFQLQPGFAAYSSMQTLPNGDLAILFEDGSIGNQDEQDCYAINYVVLSAETLNARIDELYAAFITPQVTTGTYLIKSCYGTYLTESTADNTLYCTSRLDDSYVQVWKLTVNGNTVTLYNELTGRYIQKYNGVSGVRQYSTGSNSADFTLNETNGVITFTDVSSSGLHCENTNNVVIWGTSSDASKWTIEAVTVDNTALQSQQDAMKEVKASTLSQFFTTTDCSALRSSYATMSDDDLRSAMSALPTTVQDMAVKVKNNAWATYDSWRKTEKSFRIASYQAVSDGDRWTNILQYTHRFGRLSNPTGIYATAGSYLHVYVGAIPANESVQLEVAGYEQAAGVCYPLHEGMNTLFMGTSGNCFVYYEVDNTTNGNPPYTSLATYAPVTVHIEGGIVQGYFDLTQGDTDEDWSAMKTHLMSQETVCLKTDKHVMNLKKDLLTNALGNGSITELLTLWANAAQWQDELTGRSDAQGQATYGAYCNNTYSVTSMSGNGNSNAKIYGTYYYEPTHASIFNPTQLKTLADPLWCIAHEQGHNRQQVINMVGNSEISNNFFSNVSIYQQGRFTSRTASIQATFDDFLAGRSWPERVALSCNNTDGYNNQLQHLNWQLYQFFHVLEKKSDFFPRLFDALRTDPLTATFGNTALTPASTDYLKYYVKCCQESGYDLTELFAAYGFFMLPPEQESSLTYGGVTTNRYVYINDYSKTNIYVTQEMIDAAKSQVANMNLQPCNIIFIEDRVEAPAATYEGHAADEKRQLYGQGPVKAFGEVGDYGSYAHFTSSTTPTAAYNISTDGVVTVRATSVVGFKLYDSNNNVIAYYNTRTFRLPAGSYDANGLLSGYSLKAATASTDITPTLDASITIDTPSLPMTTMWYTLCSAQRENRYVQCNGSGKQLLGVQNADDDNASHWRFIRREGTLDEYDIVSRQGDLYISPNATYGSALTAVSAQPAAGWKLKNSDTPGLFIIVSNTAQFNQANTGAYAILNWGGGNNTSDAGCKYDIKAVESIDEVSLSTTLLPELAKRWVIKDQEPANDITTNQWYVMFDRGANHGYLYEDATTHGLLNTATVPAGSTKTTAKYLVRLINAGNAKYYLQTGYGNYFGTITGSQVPTTAAPTERIAVEKIAATDGHFYLQCESSKYILDANPTNAQYPTVVGWGTTVPDAINGNNDWAFYPVELVESVEPEASELYTINNTTLSRGALMSYPAGSDKFVWSSGKSGSFDASAADCQWIFVPTGTDDQYYLYNVGKQKFVVPTHSGSYPGYSWMFSSDAVPMQLARQDDGTYKVYTADGKNIYLSVSNGYNGPIINYNDQGAQFTIQQQGMATEAVSSQLTAALAARPSTSVSQPLNAVGSKSYATLYLDYDAQTDANTKAYFITQAVDGVAQLTATADDGHQIPAYTAVVLVGETAASSASFNAGFAMSDGYSAAVTTDANLLKGTLTPMQLDLSSTSPNYSLGRYDNKIGFYKFDNGTTTTITLGANKAYLEVPAESSAVKGFLLHLDDADGLQELTAQPTATPADVPIYNLAGQRVLTPRRGALYIVNGKKCYW